MADRSRQFSRDSEKSWRARDSAEAGLDRAQVDRRRTPRARRAAISWRRWAGVRVAGSSKRRHMAGLLGGCVRLRHKGYGVTSPQRPSLHDQRAVWRCSCPHRVRRAGVIILCCCLLTRRKFEVSVWGPNRTRLLTGRGLFNGESESSGALRSTIGCNRHGCVRCPNVAGRTRERRRSGRNRPNPLITTSYAVPGDCSRSLPAPLTTGSRELPSFEQSHRT